LIIEMTTEKNDSVKLELATFHRASSVHKRHSLEAGDNDDEEATIGWEENEDDLDQQALLSSGGSSPTLAGDEFATPSKPTSGHAATTWQNELKIMLKTAPPLCIDLHLADHHTPTNILPGATFLLQYSLTMTSIFAVSHLGVAPLAAATLASTTANITGFAIYQGLCTGLDTLCSQAYGSGRYHLVGLHMQRMQLFLMLITIPMAVLWLNAQSVLERIIPDEEVAALAGRYLRVIVFGAPGVSVVGWARGCE
jgi:MATE family multidrug resistance protein